MCYFTCRSTHGRISGEMETLRLLTTSTVVDPKQVQKLYSEVVSLCARMGLELEALERYTHVHDDRETVSNSQICMVHSTAML